MTDWFNKYETYTWDIPLLKELGLKPFKGKVHEELHLGRVDIGDSSVEIWVTGCPAQWFRFQIYCAENDTTYSVSTGSGSFQDYWPMAKAVAENMFIPEVVQSEKI